MSTDKDELVLSSPKDWTFNEDDCEVIYPINPRTGKSYRFPALNGEYPLEGKPGEESEGARAARVVTVQHTPTGIAVAEDRFLPYRNKEIAMKLLKEKVLEWIDRNSKSDSDG